MMCRKKKLVINIVVGFCSQFITLVLGLCIPRIVLLNYGSDTNGLISTITQIFTYIALLEAGISQAARNMLYKPVSNGDKERISYWMSIARRYYRRISLYYFACVCVIALIMPVLLKTNISFGTVFFYIMFEGLTSVVSFYFINTWTCFLNAKGETYVNNIVNMISMMLCYTVKISLALFGINIAFIQIGYFIVSLVKLLIYKIYIGKKYTWIDYNMAPKSAKLPDRNAYVVSEITWTIFSSTDMVVLSVFVSTAMSSVYSVYNMVFVALSGLLNSIYQASVYNLGLAYHESIEKYRKLHDTFNSVFMASITVLMSVSYIMIIPFVKLYTNGVTDIEYIYKFLPLCFCMVQMLTWSRYVGGNLIGVAGRQKPAVKINIIEAIINAVLSIILVNIFGITGVLIATVCALPLKVFYCNFISDIKIIQRKPWKTISILGVNYLIFGIVVLLSQRLKINIVNFYEFFGCAIVLTVIFAFITFSINCLINRDILRTLRMVKRR